jgi:hypothetical protein
MSNDIAFDLKVQNYSIRELEEILELPSNYDASIVELKETKLRQNIMSDSNTDVNTKMRTVQFLTDAKKKILNKSVKKPVEVKPTSKTGITSFSEDALIDANTATPTEADENSIIQHKVDPYILSNPSKYFKGQYNPLNKRIIKKSLNIDTRFRENYFQTTPSNFQIELPLKFNNVVSMQLAAMELPTSFYNIDKAIGNNFFAVQDPENNIIQMIIIPDGNYAYAALINAINTILYKLETRKNQLGQDIASVINDVVFTLDINVESGSGRVIVGLQSSPATADDPTSGYTPQKKFFTLNFQTDIDGNPDHITPLPLKFAWMLGFRNAIYTNNISYVSEGLIDLSAPRYVFLSIDDHNNSVSDGFMSVYASSMLNKNILARISVRGNVFNYMAQNNLGTTTYPREYFGPVNIQRMTIQLLDEYGRVLNLHNMDYSFCLTFDTIYDF